MTNHLEFEQIETTLDPFRNETIIAENVSWEEFLVRFSETHAEWHEGRVIRVSNNYSHQTLLVSVDVSSF